MAAEMDAKNVDTYYLQERAERLEKEASNEKFSF